MAPCLGSSTCGADERPVSPWFGPFECRRHVPAHPPRAAWRRSAGSPPSSEPSGALLLPGRRRHEQQRAGSPARHGGRYAAEARAAPAIPLVSITSRSADSETAARRISSTGSEPGATTSRIATWAAPPARARARRTHRNRRELRTFQTVQAVSRPKSPRAAGTRQGERRRSAAGSVRTGCPQPRGSRPAQGLRVPVPSRAPDASRAPAGSDPCRRPRSPPVLLLVAGRCPVPSRICAFPTGRRNHHADHATRRPSAPGPRLPGPRAGRRPDPPANARDPRQPERPASGSVSPWAGEEVR